jgi:hypothetical protein
MNMSKFIGWVKTHKLSVLLIVIVAYFIFQNYSNSRGFVPMMSYVDRGSTGYGSIAAPGAISDSIGMSKALVPIPAAEVAPTDQVNRLVIKDTNLSMVVKDVPKTVAGIEAIAVGQGGYLVNANVTIPEGAATGFITIRVPEASRPQALDDIKKLGVKVISENVSGSDVTDQYVDTEARLATLYATKTKFEEILNSAVKVQDILQVQREIISLQSQIDNLKGQQKYLEQSAKLALVSVSLSTDELALPYTPDKGWRPAVIFKEAVRSLVGFARQLATVFIWIFVFTPLWLILLIAYLIWQKRLRKKPPAPLQ